jgi:RHS repeat-associated protein
MKKFLASLLLLALTATLRADDLSYTNWPSVQEWSNVSNALSQCFMAFGERYQAIKHISHPNFGYSSDPFKRYATTPFEGYVDLAKKIDKLAPYFIDHRIADANGSFDTYFAGTAPTNTWPKWTATALHQAAGFTDWATNEPLHLWMAADHSIQTQVYAALQLLKWTSCSAGAMSLEDEDNSASAFAFGDIYGYDTLDEAYTDLINEKWPSRGYTNDDYPVIKATIKQDYDHVYDKWFLYVYRTYGHFFAQNLSTQVSHTIEWYYRGTMFWGGVNVFYDFGDDVHYLQFKRFDGGSIINVNWPGYVNEVASIPFGQNNFSICPLPTEIIDNENTWGYAISSSDITAALKWNFKPMDTPVMSPNIESTPDSDRDDIVELARDISSFGPDTGNMFWMPEQETPYVMLPIARTPLWSGSFPVHAYLCEGGTTNLPFQYLVQGIIDNDGHYQAYSLNTRVIESGVFIKDTTKIKRAAVLRPRGNVVIFDFAWDAGANKFKPDGYPIGVNNNRTYVLRDMTPDNHTDKVFDLYFDSGIVHHFSGTITAISDEVGMQLPVSANSIPGASITLTNKASDAKYDVALTWTAGRLTQLAYSSKDHTATVTVTVDYDSDNSFITGIAKTGLDNSDASVSGATITYDWGTVTRSVSDNTVTLSTALDTGGSRIENYTLNAAGRVLEHKITANGDSATSTYEYYDSASGRYANGTPKNAKLKKITHADGFSLEFTYATDTGWLTQEKRPVGNGSERFTMYAYSHAGDSTANPTNLYERPRVVSKLYDSTTIATTYFAYNGPAQTEIQECAVAGAAWDASDSLVTTNTYCTGGLTNGLLLAATTPLGTSAFTYDIAGLSGNNFTALGKLTSSSVHSTGQTETNVLNAFGVREKAITLDTDSGQTIASTISTVDAFGRPTQTTFLDGTSESYFSWTLHGPEEITGIDGSISTYEYYDNGRVKEIDRGDTGVLLEYQYDALGNRTASTATGEDAATVSSSASYDAQSRLISRTDLLGATTYNYANQSYGVETTITYADNSVLTRQQYQDGSIKQISGNAAKAKRQYEYGIAGGLFYAKQIRPVGGAATEWTKKTFDAVGNVSRIEHSGAGGEATTISFDARGRLDGWEDEEGVARVLTYTDRNEVKSAGLDFDGGGSLVPASRDRYLTSAYNVSASGSKYSGYVYPTDNSANSNLLTEIEVALDGKQIASSYAGRTDTLARGTYSPGGSFTVTNALSDETKLVQQYEAWRLKETKRYENGSGSPWETETLDYDGLGALLEVDNSRKGLTVLEYDSARRLAKITLPDPAKLPIEIKYWDGTDRIKSIRRPDGSYLRFDYYPNGLLKRRYDLGTYDLTCEYDDQGRCVKQTTDRDGTPVVTEWIFNGISGLLEEKKIAGITAETYTHRDNGQIATVADANGVVAAHVYNGAGDLAGITYSDGTTAPISVAFNRRGQVAACGQSGVSNLFSYALDGQMATNTVVGAGVVPDAQLAYAYGATQPDLESAVFTVNGSARAVTVGRNARKLVTSLADGDVTAQYTYESGAPFVNAVTVKVDGASVMTRSIGWDLVNDRMTNIACTVAGSNVASFAYTWQTNADRIARVSLSDGSYWTYDYDSRGHLISGERFFADGSPYFGMQYGAQFDSIGNTLRGGVLSGSEPENRFTPNDFNVHVSRVWSNRVEILGRAATNATVTINDSPTDRAGEWFRAVITVNNAASAVETNIAITAVWFDPVASNDVVACTTGSICIAKSTEGPSYDARASITNDSRYRLTYDAFGRLTEVINTAVTPNARETYTYFADGRRATKNTFRGTPGAWTNTFSHAFIYDRWNLISERITDELEATTSIREYVWGLDLAGQRDGEIGQKAGGIGGLLAIREITGIITNTYVPICDHSGNILHVVDAATYEIVASYLYAPFGKLIGVWGAKSDVCPFRFQSKYYDAETELYYFGYRYYNPASVKWITRDPLGEEGGFNLTAAFGGDPVNRIDPKGLMGYTGNEGLWSNSKPTPWAHADSYSELPLELLLNAGGTLQWLTENLISAPFRGSAGFALQAGNEGVGIVKNELNVQVGAGTGDALELMLVLPSALGRFPRLFEVLQETEVAVNEWQAARPLGSAAGNVLLGSAEKASVRTAFSTASESASAPVSEVAKSGVTALTKFYPENAGFAGATERTFLMPGQTIDRYGGSGFSRFFSPQGTADWARSLPPGTSGQPLRTFEIVKPFEVQSGTIAPWFNQPGGALQYRTPVNLDALLNREIIKEVTP